MAAPERPDADRAGARPVELAELTVKHAPDATGDSTSIVANAAASQPGVSRSVATGHADQALHVAEVRRARGMAVVLGGLAASCIPVYHALGPDVRAIVVGDASAGYFALVCAVVWFVARPDASYPRLFRWFSASAALSSAPIIYCVGTFSPAPIALAVGISFFGTGRDTRWAITCCGFTAAAYLTMAVLIVVGILPDFGTIHGGQNPMALVMSCAMVPIMFVSLLTQSMALRRGVDTAMAQVQDAVRVVQQRDDQLVEVNRDLDRALEAGVGQYGRHTGRQAGAWTLGALIGRGAMGEVYSAVSMDGRSRAAVKTLVNTDGDQIARFEREAELAAKVRSPGLVTLYGSGVLDRQGRQVPYLVMELLSGHDLSWHLRQARRLDVGATLTLIRQIAAGLADAHQVGIVHRDIKPQNLFCHEPPEGGPPSWKVLDFGIAKLSESLGTLTQNMIIGTPGYMSPEQARGRHADARSDLFSLGAVVYRALTAQAAFRGPDTPSLLFDVVYRAPRRPSELVPGLAPDLDRFIAIAMAKRADDRFTTATAFAAALEAAAAESLPDQLRQRADALIRALPWGGRLRD